MSAHTPGPWARDGRTVYALMHAGWRKGVEVFKNRFYATVQKDAECSEEEAEANARLIAASPELLHALKDMVRLANGCIENITDEEQKVVDQALSAIAKAEGKS